MAKKKTDPKLDAWIAARKRHRLSHAHVQMVRELRLNPAKLGKIDNHRQEPWKAPLPEFIESLYEKRLGRLRPEKVLSLEELARERTRKEQARREAKAQRRLTQTSEREAGAGDRKYDEAVTLAVDLRDASVASGHAGEFETRIATVRKQHSRRRGYLDRLKGRLGEDRGGRG